MREKFLLINILVKVSEAKDIVKDSRNPLLFIMATDRMECEPESYYKASSPKTDSECGGIFWAHTMLIVSFIAVELECW